MDDVDARPTARPLGPLPPRHVRHDLLDEETYAAFLSHVLASRARFQPGQVQSGYHPAKRNCLNLPLPESDPWHERLLGRILASDPLGGLSVKPFDIWKAELELSAYNDGAFFRPHIDTVTGRPGRDTCRIVSGVYYLHVEPKRFEGGALRFYRFGSGGGEDEEHVDFAPQANSCIFFPSWAPHEVRPVRCASGRFEDSRFAVNVWLHGRHRE
ncbi:MAG TPA: 2OG-Fe(II) oxygenase [Allosphingosinicella sp.]|jgi:Rps23 Pro-64 3,4-dihydroxylase Tpa1-like proline 4-hydroxylase